MYHWNLNNLYTGFNDTYEQDKKDLAPRIEALAEAAANLSDQASLEAWMMELGAINQISKSLMSYAHLRSTTDATDSDAMAQLGQVQALLAGMSTPSTRFQKFVIEHQETIKTWFETSDFLREHRFVLQEIMDSSDYLLDENVEAAISKMRMNASTNWSKLHGALTSMQTIEMNGKKETLSSLRNYAYVEDATVRKEAYEKELELCASFDDSIAFALNSIKGEVNTLNAMRGYNSPLDKTLKDSRMSQETLDALLQAMEESMPMFRKYFKHKAKLLGHEGALPWYDLFAPLKVGEIKKYTVEEAMALIVTSFRTFSDELADMAQTAFDDAWIDFLPYEGKRDGAFCSNQAQIKQSYILSNFDGSISSIVTLAHELGHAFHGLMIQDLSPLNTSYTMPVAETASTFCENILINAALESASESEQLLLLENSISDSAQIIVDIMSRYLFESEVFERRQNEFLNPSALKDIMLDAQRQTYGDAISETARHPYMWLVKGHYYSGSLSFYNFPYAFGGLFALGLYASYQSDKTTFVPKYRDLLAATTTATCEDVALKAAIDVTDVAFWRSSLKQIEAKIERFIELTPVA